MDYEREILKVLYESGRQGLSVKKISVHVFNAQNSLFSSSSYEEVRKKVAAFLHRNSGKKHSPVKRTSVRGRYCINLKAQAPQTQMSLRFDDREPQDNAPGIGKKDLSLSLFD